MASNDERVPPQANGVSLNDSWDARRIHQGLSNPMSNGGHDPRDRASSNASQDPYLLNSLKYQQARQPINDAVASAFNNADATSANSFSPELLQQITSQITANVLQQLKASSMPGSTQPQPPSSQLDTASSTAGSPPLDRATVYTPPSPYRSSEDQGMSQPSPQFPPPPPSNQSSFAGPPPPTEKRPVSPLSQSGHQSEGEARQERPVRPKGPRRISTGGDPTILERVWGTMFDEEGQATPRLGQFLRGIATHLIEDYEPKNSLVITPTKMQRYYEETKLPTELYPWTVIFDDRTSSISRMYREIEAEHHLVQDKLNERPDIPGLTPRGFETWATLLLKAHPDQEFERMARTALDMPISNPDEKKERFPKELSRRLFPARPDTELAYNLQKAISAHCNVTFGPRPVNATDSHSRAAQSGQAADESTPKPSLRPAPESKDPVNNVNNVTQSHPAPSAPSIERQRQPYSGATSDGGEGVVEEEAENMSTPQPIERERKPYVAAPGGGKNHDNLDKSNAAHEPRQPPVPQAVNLARSDSSQAPGWANDMPGPNTNPVAIHQRAAAPPPVEMPEARRHRSNSTYHRDQPRSGRNRSPSMTKDNASSSYARRSEADALHTPSFHPPYSASEHPEDTRRYKEYELQRERLANDRYDAARMAAYDPRERDRDRERETRPRMQSVSAARNPPSYSSSVPSTDDEDYYRYRGMHMPSTPSYTTPVSISSGFQAPAPTSGTRESTSGYRDTAYGSYPSTAAYPPSGYRDAR